MQNPLMIRKVAVLGAGVMGAQIAAHCVNAGFQTLLFDLPSDEKDRSIIAKRAIQKLNKLKPTPLATPDVMNFIHPKNYQDNLDDLTECDLIIEAIAERLDWKTELYHRVAPYLSEKTVLVSNTSGLSIETLSKSLPEALKHRFCGVHFFNPPRYMHLAELIPTNSTEPELLDKLETWLTSYLGKGVVRAKDTPNFIANRIGVFSLLSTMHHALQMDLGLDEVDLLTGTLIGRPKSATFRTMDVVGLDTMAHVINTMHESLASDPWHAYFKLPPFLMELIEEGALGQKSSRGIYRKNGKQIEVYDIKTGSYKPSNATLSESVKKIFQAPDHHSRLRHLFDSQDKQCQFLAKCFIDLFHYSAFHLESIAKSVREVDLAMRWGFGWQQGPFEIWEDAGSHAITKQITHAIQEKTTMASAALPNWLEKLESFYLPSGAWSAELKDYIKKESLAVYRKQIFPVSLPKEPKRNIHTLFETESVHLYEAEDAVPILSFKTKANTIDSSLIDGLNEALNLVEASYQGLLLYQSDELNFSSGANLKAVYQSIQQGDFAGIEALIHAFQQLALRLKYFSKPVVAALRGRALGGGCELMMHCSRTVASFEAYPGLVEVGVGVIPAGGGCKELALRVAQHATQNDISNRMKAVFEQTAMGQVATCAQDAKRKLFLRQEDRILMHKNEVWYGALTELKALSEQNFRPPLPNKVLVAGREGRAMFKVGLVNWLKGGFISEHDDYIADKLAYVLCGGDVNEGEQVTETWLLKLEREAFIDLVKTPKTQQRIEHFLKTGKPLRN